MSGEKNLRALLASMSPRLNDGQYVFTLAPAGAVPTGVRPVATVLEDEGLTLVVPREDADREGLAYDYVAAWITLRVHSALDAVGLTAAFATALATAGLSCNVVAGLHHDHLFVPYDDAPRALDVLASLTG
ncbi:acetyltransferase [Streptomyces sp. CC53]|uniref:ACT domain-containing protein n=1 Tax=unclassified Streptomyces TaxID=2593676 RepID=UPI0008DCB1C4|nr:MULTISPECIES: ACT domain-containing protein [unclassified Streptomyces]OII59919.1 acetyltransferase [Streptomyces sp. CC53]OII68122.1 acetyltransferase [Streptomyces sp. CC77]